jgi:cytochrome c peroxidase
MLGAWQGIVAAPMPGGKPPTPGARSQEPRADFDEAEWKAKYRRPKLVPFPDENKYTKERELLGRTLFFDPRLSSSNQIACASCHNPALAWGDGLPRAIGHNKKVLGRRSPTILNLAWGELYFWDGRAASLEEQALGPIASPVEMNLPLDEMVRKLEGIPGYRDLFYAAYPGDEIGEETVAKGIATFVRTVVSERAPFDRWIAGDDTAISEQAKRGFKLFNTKGRCMQCHNTWRFTDDSFHDIGVKGIAEDKGRGVILEEIEAMQYAFKTPTLRNVDRRSPYMHDGSVETLEDVINQYSNGGGVKRPSLSEEIKPLLLSAGEKRDLIAFLKTLTSVDRPAEVPTLPR